MTEVVSTGSADNLSPKGQKPDKRDPKSQYDRCASLYERAINKGHPQIALNIARRRVSLLKEAFPSGSQGK